MPSRVYLTLKSDQFDPMSVKYFGPNVEFIVILYNQDMLYYLEYYR